MTTAIEDQAPAWAGPGAGRHFINGEFRESAGHDTFAVINPATEEVVARAARGRADDVDHAVRSAKDAFDDGVWSRAQPSRRRELLMRVADLLDDRAGEIDRAEAVEMGKPVGQGPARGAPGGTTRAAWNFRFFAMEQELAEGRSFNRDDALLTYTMADPAGVFGLITPWNGPLLLSTWKIAPCLAYGNSAVHKPSELSSLSIGILGDIFREAGLPAGVYNTVLGYGSEAGVDLVEHSDVIGVSFTGSPRTARDIASRCASHLKRTSFELGGKSACVVFADTELGPAVPKIAANIFGNSGQMCAANSRVLVQRAVHEEFVERLVAEAETWTIGDPLDPSTRLGPLASHGQYQRVMSYLELARAEGRIVHGGRRPPERSRGYFVEPTVVVDAPNSSRICQEEIFGPVATVLPFDDADQAIAVANDSTYGLAGYVWTKNHAVAQYVSLRLHAGMVWINDSFNRDIRQPLGGSKQSGLGREGALVSREFFTETKFISTPTEPR